MFKISHPHSAVLLELNADGVARRVVFRPGEERGVVIGSTPLADFRVNGVRVAPVEFHLERSGEGIWLIPAYGIRDLRLNAARVSGPTSLEAHNVIEFGGVRLCASVSETDAVDSDAASAPGDHVQALLGTTYSLDLPNDQDATQLAMPRVAMPPADSSTVAISRTRIISIEAADEISTALPDETRRLNPFRQAPQPNDRLPAITSNGTEIMTPYRPGSSIALKPASQAPPENLRPDPLGAAHTDAEGAPLVQLRNAPRPPAVDRPTPSATLQAASGPLAALAIPASVPSNPRSDNAPQTARDTRMPSVPPQRPRVSWLARLGLLTQAHPFLVGCCAGVGAFVLAALPLIAARAIRNFERPAAAHSAQPLRVALNALQPTPEPSAQASPKPPGSNGSR